MYTYSSTMIGWFLAAILLVLLPRASCYIARSDTEPDCPDIKCFNKGVLDNETCTCNCDGEHTGFFCETELHETAWPRGRYSLLSTVFGCPESDNYGWHRGYINLTLGVDGPAQRWKMPFEFSDELQSTDDPHLLGPYHHYALQLNFCTRLDPDPDPGLGSDLDVGADAWPNGTYCVFNAGESCMEGFSENYVLISGYHMTMSDTDGVLPNVSMTTNSSFTLSYCCRTGGEENATLDLPHDFPFMLLKKHGSACNPVPNMAVNEERFDLVDNHALFEFEGPDSIFTKSEDFQRLGLCYYEKTAVRECYHAIDKAWSYVGLVNVTADGVPCLNWYDVNPEFRPSRKFVGDDYTQNHCRTPQTTNPPPSVPMCFVNHNLDYSVSLRKCSVPECELDPELEEVGMFKPVYAVENLEQRGPENAVDGNFVGLPFEAKRPIRKPWIQVDLEEGFLVYGVLVRRRYSKPGYGHSVWFPVNFRFAAVHVSYNRWDFINYGALQCQRRRNPRKAMAFLFMCYRPIAGQFVTIRNFDDPSPDSSWGAYFSFEIQEITVLVKRTVCTRHLGLLSGEVRDFQLSGSGDTPLTMFERGRLLMPGAGWCWDRVDDPYFMIDLLVPTVVSGLEIQGWLDGQNVMSVEEFTLDFALKQDNFQPYLDPMGQPKLFRLDTSLPPNMVKRIMLYKPVVARYIRVNIVTYSGMPCLKMELIGCPKRASRDLSCGENTMFWGYDSIRRSAFWMTFTITSNRNTSMCIKQCTQMGDSCVSIYHKPGNCTLLNSTRYNPHYDHWFLSGLNSHRDQTLTKLCIKDIQETRVCGGEISEPTELESPSYPFYYGQLITCTWKIQFSHRSYVRVKIRKVHLAVADTQGTLRQNGVFDFSPGQCIDTLNIDGLIISSENETGYQGSVVVSRSDVAMVTLTSCARYSVSDARGFLLEVSHSDYPGCRSSDGECLADCRVPAAIITSPAYPFGLKPGTNCRWSINGELGQFVELSFKVMDIRGSASSCEVSHVNVINEDLHGLRTRLGTYCSYALPLDTVRSSWHHLHVELEVGDDSTGNGFMAEYRLVDYVQHGGNTPGQDNQGCGDWKGYKGSCYQVFEDDLGLTWLSAERACQAHDSNLTSIASRAEASFIHTMLTQKLFDISVLDLTFYIGLRKIGSGERYVNYQWSDGSPLTFTAWFRNATSGQSQPDGLENEGCTRMFLYSIHSLTNWHDVACAYDKTRMFICERPSPAHDNSNVSLEFDSGLTFAFPVYHQFSREDFPCTSGEFVHLSYVCDSHQDCMDGSDENKTLCGDYCGFACDNGQCVHVENFCDFRQDCDDGSDETSCVLAECLESEWRCNSGQCILGIYRCDVKHDCYDGSDEEACDTCQPSSSFQCYDQRCVPNSRICDGYSDCSGRFNEDETQGCIQATQISCADWYTIGARTNGSYLISMATTTPFEVECRFIERQDGTVLIQTLVHHDFEATVTWTSELREIKLLYPTKRFQLERLKVRGPCKQYLSIECSYLIHGLGWKGDRGLGMHSSHFSPDCACPYVGNCDGGGNHKCNCSTLTIEDWYGMAHDAYLADSGYVRAMQYLPIRNIPLGFDEVGTFFSSGLRTTIGPLICEEEINLWSGQDMIVCDNDNLADKSNRCVLDFDEFGETKGCRDLSHIESCANLTCPANHARCSDGHCLPYYLVCDGVKHCSSGEDERDCELQKACQNSLSCRKSSICVPSENVCDGVVHCPLGDDEWLCHTTCMVSCSCFQDSMFCEAEVYLTGFATISFDKFRSTRELLLQNSRPLDVEFNATAFTSFPYLLILKLSTIRLKLLHPYQFDGNSNLLSLDLRNNLITVLYENTFWGLGKLKVLLLTGNPLHEIKPLAFNGLGFLSSLELTGLAISNLIPSIFSGLSLLSKLNLSNSRIVGVDSDTFADLPNLQTLDVRNNEISEFNKGIFNGLTGLEYIYSSDFTLCCLRPENVREENCLPSKDEFSSCDDLMRNQVLRAFLWIIGGLALLGNIGVLIYRFIVDRQGLSKTYGVFVSNLGVADFLMGVYLVILAAADTMFRGSYVWNDHHWRNGAVCKIAGVLSVLGSEGSVIFLCLITLDRILVVKYPFGNVRISRKVCIGICICSWLFLFLLALVPLSTGDYFQGAFYSRSAVCLALPLTRDRPPGFEYSIAMFIVLNLAAFMVIAATQISIYREVIASRGKLTSKGRRNDMTIARNLFLVAITDFLCWFPVGVMGVMALSGQVISGEVYAWTAVFVLPINSALNPFIYTIGAQFNKARANKRSIIKRSGRKSKGGSTDITAFIRNKAFHFGKTAATGKITLMDLTSQRTLEPLETLVLAARLAKSLHILHCVDLVHGTLATDKVYLKDTNKGLAKIAVLTSPKHCEGEEDLATDIKAYGDTIKHVLKSTSMKNA